MIEVVEKTRELGEAIVASKEYREMQLAEAEAESDPAAVQLRFLLFLRDDLLFALKR